MSLPSAPPPQGEPNRQPESPSPAPARVYRAPREWTRVHAVSPFLGVGPIVGAVLFYLVISRTPDWVGGGDDTVSVVLDAAHGSWLLVVAVIVAVILIIVGGSLLSWRMTQYRIGDDAVYQRKGVLFRQQRQARLDRLQAVDVVQPLVARLFGFGAIRIEVAGGDNSGIALEYLRIGDAEALRNEIIEIAAGYKRSRALPAAHADDAVAGVAAAPGTAGLGMAAPAEAQGLGTAAPGAAEFGTATPGTATPGTASFGTAIQGDNLVLGGLLHGSEDERISTPAAAERQVYSVPNGRLIGSIALSWPTFWLVLTPIWLVAVMVVFGIDFSSFLVAAVGTSLVTAVPVIFGLLGYFWTRLNRGFNFAAGISQDGIRLRHGLLETRRQTVPPGRVQAVRLRQSLWWRRAGWWEVTINVAGYQSNQEAVSTLLTVGSRAEALEALWLVLPSHELANGNGATDSATAPDGAAEGDTRGAADGVIAAAMEGTYDDQGFTVSPAASRWFDLFQWRQRGVRATETALLIRSGRFVKDLCIVPHERTQSLALQQGPLQRAFGLASIEIHSTNGPVKPLAKHLRLEDAIALLDAQAERAREGRKRQTPEQWMKAVGLNA